MRETHFKEKADGIRFFLEFRLEFLLEKPDGFSLSIHDACKYLLTILNTYQCKPSQTIQQKINTEEILVTYIAHNLIMVCCLTVCVVLHTRIIMIYKIT